MAPGRSSCFVSFLLARRTPPDSLSRISTEDHSRFFPPLIPLDLPSEALSRRSLYARSRSFLSLSCGLTFSVFLASTARASCPPFRGQHDREVIRFLFAPLASSSQDALASSSCFAESILLHSIFARALVFAYPVSVVRTLARSFICLLLYGTLRSYLESDKI